MGRPRKELPAPLPVEEVIGTKEAAAMLSVSISTVQKMVESGVLEAWRTQGGHRRITLESVKRAAGRVGERAPAKNSRQPLSVLVVEDNPTLVRTYEKVLSQWGAALQFRFASNGAQALLQVAREMPDLLITDLLMKPFDGFYLIEAIRSHPDTADLKVLVLTELSPEEIEERGGLDEKTLCYRKPLQYERLAGYLDARLQDRAFLGGARKSTEEPPTE